MINVPIDITHTEDETTVSDIMEQDVNGNATTVNKIAVPGMYISFANKFIDVLKALASKKRFFYTHRISSLSIKNNSDLDVCITTIKSKEGSSQLFEPLRRLGIMTATLEIGISHDRKRLYLTNKLLRDISKFSGTIQSGIVMYLMSIAYAFENLADITPTVTSVFGSAVETSITDWSSYLYSFKAGDTVEVVEIPTDDLKAIRYYNNVYSTPSKITSVYPENSCIIAYNMDKNQRFLIISRDIDDNVFWVVNANESKVYTNDSLVQICTDFDTFPGGFTLALNKTVDVIHTSKLQDMFKDDDYEIGVEFDEALFPEDSTYANIVNYYNSTLGIVSNKLKKILPKTKHCAGFIDKETIVEQYTTDEYAQQLYTQAHDYYDSFDLKTLNNSVKGFANGDIFAMMFTGAAGTGKSTSARVIPYRCGIPYVSINFCVNIEESDLIGTMIPNPEKSTVEDPEFIWQDGIITKAVRNGYCVVLEEINFARPGVLGKLNSLLDENRQIDLPTGEILKAHPNFRMIATCNIAYEGTNRFNKAFINRFEMIHEFTDLEKLEAFTVIKSRCKNVDDTKLSRIYTVYELLKKYSNEQGLDVIVSIRQLFNLFRQGKYYPNAYNAVIDILINGAFIELPEYKEKFVSTVLENMKKELMFKL